MYHKRDIKTSYFQKLMVKKEKELLFQPDFCNILLSLGMKHFLLIDILTQDHPYSYMYFIRRQIESINRIGVILVSIE